MGALRAEVISVRPVRLLNRIIVGLRFFGEPVEGWAVGGLLDEQNSITSNGDVQPTEQPWTLQGMCNNMTQRVEVIVR